MSRDIPSDRQLFNEAVGLWYHGGAFSYSVLGFVAGIAGILNPSLLVNFCAVILLAHAMTIAAYLVHEAAHNTIFRKQRHNVRVGRTLSWICGAAYNRFEDIRFKHFRHHVENDDIVWFDYERFFRRHPRVLAITRVLEWFYIPAHELLMHSVMIVNAFVVPERSTQRRYNLLVILARGSLFVALMTVSLKAALLYVLAYMLMLVVLRFMDSLQHDYSYTLTLFSTERSAHYGDSDWEQRHTFSVPHSLKWPWLNWLTLNFGYHNAHHAYPGEPWYRLPAIHATMTRNDPEKVISFRMQLKIYHQGRVGRIIKWDDEANDAPTPDGAAFLKAARRGEVYGGNAASFLTAL